MLQILTQEDFDKIRQLQARSALAPALTAREVTAVKLERDILDENAILPDLKKKRQVRPGACRLKRRLIWPIRRRLSDGWGWAPLRRARRSVWHRWRPGARTEGSTASARAP